MQNRNLIIAALILLFSPASALAGMDDFHAGEAIKGFGKFADVPAAMSLPEGIVIKHSFDVSQATKAGEINRSLDSAARFINMHYSVGVPLENINVAIVVHGGSTVDTTNGEFYAARKDGAENVNIQLIDALLAAGARIIVCGQSATARDVYKKDLLPGVEMALSAMTAHMLLQQDGYTLNPF